nr:protein BIG GRAIN 1-like A [Tanacetum cinerariifolium]
MYNWDKSHKEDRPRKNGQIPSFTSTLLDEIYQSIDGGDEKFCEFKVRKPKVAKKPIRRKSVEDEEIASFRRACLVEKWMEMKANEKENSLELGFSVLAHENVGRGIFLHHKDEKLDDVGG